MGEFFTEIKKDNLSPDQIRLLQSYDHLTEEQQELVLSVIKSYEKANGISPD